MVVCVECGLQVQRLFRDFGAGNIRLTKCEHCGAIADKYIEFDTVNLLLEMLLLKEAVYRHMIFNRIRYAVNSRRPASGAPKSSASSTDDEDAAAAAAAAGEENVDVSTKPQAHTSGEMLRSLLVIAGCDVYVKWKTLDSGFHLTDKTPTSFVEGLDRAIHRVLFSQVVKHTSPVFGNTAFSPLQTYIAIMAVSLVELVVFLSVITVGVLILQKTNRASSDFHKYLVVPWREIAVAAGFSQFGKVAPVVMMVWSSAPDIRLAVSSFNLSACVVIVKLTSGTKGVKALYVIATAVLSRLLVQFIVANWIHQQYPCSIITAFG